MFPGATAEEAHMNKRQQAKYRILYENQTTALKHIFEVCLSTIRKMRKNAHIHDLHFTFDFKIKAFGVLVSIRYYTNFITSFFIFIFYFKDMQNINKFILLILLLI